MHWILGEFYSCTPGMLPCSPNRRAPKHSCTVITNKLQHHEIPHQDRQAGKGRGHRQPGISYSRHSTNYCCGSLRLSGSQLPARRAHLTRLTSNLFIGSVTPASQSHNPESWVHPGFLKGWKGRSWHTGKKHQNNRACDSYSENWQISPLVNRKCSWATTRSVSKLLRATSSAT